jgi:hypothetical protein
MVVFYLKEPDLQAVPLFPQVIEVAWSLGQANKFLLR